jgi:FAD/FMN-containing dehydrogenase
MTVITEFIQWNNHIFVDFKGVGVNLKWQDALASLAQDSGFEALQTGKHVISYVNDFAQPLNDLLMGDIFINVRKEIKAIHTKYREIRLFVATHMHAGDGNVHTNIPVHSYHTAMLSKSFKGWAKSFT